MTTVPGTYFTEEQLEADLKGNDYFYSLPLILNKLMNLFFTADKVTAGIRIGSDKLNHYGFLYDTEKKQYDKALAWYILAAKENNSTAQNNIGFLYHNGFGVPMNYLCALKWYLKAAEQNEYQNTPNNIGKLFKHGQGVPLDKYKALEWHCYGGDKSHRDRLKKQGYHRSATDKSKLKNRMITLY
jgi:TPR repeat protein